MIRPERIVIEPHSNTGEERMPGIVERSVFLGGAHEVHIRVLGGELLKAMVPNDGVISPAVLESGAAVCLHLPADALRVLTATEPADEAEAEQADATASAPP
jgi:spermidine/putrescine transport system ATP-binding protein